MTTVAEGRDEMTEVYEVQLNSQGSPNFATAQKVLRCKYCKDWYPFSDKLFGYCRREFWDDDGQYRLKVETNHDDYCSYGERRDV